MFKNDMVLVADQERYVALEEQAKRIEDRILDLRQQLSVVRAERNSLVCINRNPDDILLEIFASLVQQAGSDYHGYPLVDASQVCRRWRAVALSSPVLWTHIALCSVEQVRTFAERSQSMPLHVSLAPAPQGHPPGLVSSLPPLIPRLRTLALKHNFYREWADWKRTLSSRAAPLLEDLAVKLKPTEAIPDYAEFGASFPALRSLRLDSIFFPAASPVFQNLRHLRLVSRSPSALTIGDYFRILGRCPELETLELGPFHGNSPSEPDAQIPHPVPLPRLVRVELENCADWIPAALLRNLDLPLSTQITLRSSVSSIAGRFPQSLPALATMAGFQSLVVTCTTSSSRGSSFALCAYREPHATAEPAFRFEASHIHGEPRIWTHTLSELVDVRAVRRLTLHLEGTTFHRHDVVRPLVLAGFGALETLCVGGSRAGLFHPELLAYLSADTRTPTGALVCPTLQELELAGAYGSETFWNALKTMVRDRRSVGNFRRVRLVGATGIANDKHRAVREVRALLDELAIVATDAAVVCPW